MSALAREDSSPRPGYGSGDEKKHISEVDLGADMAMPRGRAAWFSGGHIQIGPRIGPVLTSISSSYDGDESSGAILDKQFSDEEGASIQYRTCSWQKVCFFFTAWLSVAEPALGSVSAVVQLVPYQQHGLTHR